MQWYGFTNTKPKYPNDQPPPPPRQPPRESHVNHQLLMQIPGCTVHLMDEGEAVKIAGPGDLTVLRIIDNNLSLATILKVGKDLQWPLTKDEPVVKLDDLHYLFTIPIRGGDPLSFGVGFSKKSKAQLAPFDSFLQQSSCFSCPSRNGDVGVGGEIDWKEFAPRIEDYNGVLARAIAGGTGQIIKGIFMCSNTYTNQVQKGGELILTQAKEDQKHRGGNRMTRIQIQPQNKGGIASVGGRKKTNTQLDMNLKRARKLSEMTEKMSKDMLDGLGVASASVMGPLVRSKTGQAFLSMMPGEVLVASLDAIDRIMNAAEAAEKQTLQATSGAAVRAMEERFGESAGEVTGDAFATAGHVANAAWNVYNIRKAFNPASSASTGVLKGAQNFRKSKP